MKGWAKSTLVLLTILLVSTVFFALLYRPPDPEAVTQVPLVYVDLRISASGMEPAVIRVSQGTLVALNVTSMDEDHQFGLTAFGIARWISVNETAELRFHANLAGTFGYRCLITAPGHVEEEGTLQVIPRG